MPIEALVAPNRNGRSPAVVATRDLTAWQLRRGLPPQHLLTPLPPPPRRGVFRALGLGLITGAADDDPSAIGTYASAGAALGPSFLWTAPVTFPMMFAVVYLSSKLGQVAGKGLFAVIKDHYPRWILYPALAGVMIGNTIEAGADLGGMAAAVNLLIPVSVGWIVVAIALAILAFPAWSGIVQGFSTPPLMLLILLMTNDRKIMGERVNGWGLNLLGGLTTAAIWAASLCLLWTWIRPGH
jgi:Mn2+/Fe2+ NRAMP family transporter